MGVEVKLSRATVADTKIAGPNMELVSGLLHLSVGTRRDISEAVGELSRFMAFPRNEHSEVAKRELRYTPDLGTGLDCSADAHFGGD